MRKNPNIVDSGSKAPSTPSRTGRPRLDGRAPITREKVLEAATALFAEHGFAGTSVRMIAGRLGAHATSIFHHFATKEAVLDAVVAALFERHIELFEATGRRGIAPEEALLELLEIDLRACTEAQPSVARLLLLPELRSPNHPLATQGWGRLVDVYARLIAEGQARQVIRPGDPRIVAESLLVLAMTPFASLTLNAEGREAEIVDTIAALALRAILCDPDHVDVVRKGRRNRPHQRSDVTDPL